MYMCLKSARVVLVDGVELLVGQGLHVFTFLYLLHVSYIFLLS